jgi:hypothetical protein
VAYDLAESFDLDFSVEIIHRCVRKSHSLENRLSGLALAGVVTEIFIWHKIFGLLELYLVFYPDVGLWPFSEAQEALFSV